MPLTLQSYCPVRLLFKVLFHVIIHCICLPFVGMVTTRSAQANYILVPTSNLRPVRSNCTPNSKYFAQLHGRAKVQADKIQEMPNKLDGFVLSLVSKLYRTKIEARRWRNIRGCVIWASSSFHHSHFCVKFSKARQRKSEAIIEFKEQLKTFYNQSY